MDHTNSSTRLTHHLQTSGKASRALLTILILFLASAAAWSGETGRCAAADVPVPMVLPDGERIPAGLLTVCYEAEYSPVAGLHQVSINGRRVGSYIARNDKTPQAEQTLQADEERPYFIFNRTADGALELHSYHRPLPGDQVSNHRLWPEQPDISTHWKTAQAGESGMSHRVLLAAL